MTALAETIAAQAELLREVLALNLDDAVSQLEPAGRVWLGGYGNQPARRRARRLDVQRRR